MLYYVIIIYCNILLLWLYIQKLKYYESIEKQKWIKFIDNKAYENSFWIKYYNIVYVRNTVYYILVIYYLCTATPFVILTIHNKRSMLGNPAKGTELALLFGASGPTQIILIILACIFPKYQDSIGLRIETIKTTIVYLVNVSLSGLCNFIITDPLINLICQAIFAGPGWAIWLYMIYGTVLRTYHLPHNCCNAASYKIDITQEFSFSSSDTRTNNIQLTLYGSDSNKKLKSKKKPKFTQCLRYPNMLNKFALHLIQEFAIENLLFIYELQQFKMKLTDIYGINKNIIDFCNDVPSSPIANKITTDVTEVSSKIDAFINLCIKYIFDNAKFQVNISFKSRRHINSIFGIDNNYFNASNLDRNRDKYQQIIKKYITNNNDNIKIENLDDIFKESEKDVIQFISYAWIEFTRDEHFNDYLKEIV